MDNLTDVSRFLYTPDADMNRADILELVLIYRCHCSSYDKGSCFNKLGKKECLLVSDNKSLKFGTVTLGLKCISIIQKTDTFLRKCLMSAFLFGYPVKIGF